MFRLPASRFLSLGALILGAALCISAGAAAQSSETPSDREATIPLPEQGVFYFRAGEPGGVKVHSRNGARADSAQAPPPAQAEHQGGPRISPPLNRPPSSKEPIDVARLIQEEIDAALRGQPGARRGPVSGSLLSEPATRLDVARLEGMLRTLQNRFDNLRFDDDGAPEAYLPRESDDTDVIDLRRADQERERLREMVAMLQDRLGEVEGQADATPDDQDYDAAAVRVLEAELERLRNRLSEMEEAEAQRPMPTPPSSDGRVTAEQVERAILETGLFRAVNVNFEFNESTLLPTAERSLRTVGEVLTRYPQLRIEVAGHTDAIGTERYNQRLSQRRAESARAFLLTTFPEIDPANLTARGYGESEPIASNDNPTGRTLNRRVEFRLLNPEAAERILNQRQTQREITDTDEITREQIRQILREEMGRTRENDDN